MAHISNNNKVRIQLGFRLKNSALLEAVQVFTMTKFQLQLLNEQHIIFKVSIWSAVSRNLRPFGGSIEYRRLNQALSYPTNLFKISCKRSQSIVSSETVCIIHYRKSDFHRKFICTLFKSIASSGQVFRSVIERILLQHEDFTFLFQLTTIKSFRNHMTVEIVSLKCQHAETEGKQDMRCWLSPPPRKTNTRLKRTSL